MVFSICLWAAEPGSCFLRLSFCVAFKQVTSCCVLLLLVLMSSISVSGYLFFTDFVGV